MTFETPRAFLVILGTSTDNKKNFYKKHISKELFCGFFQWDMNVIDIPKLQIRFVVFTEPVFIFIKSSASVSD